MQVITHTARERKQLADFCFNHNWDSRTIEMHLRDAMPETLMWRLGKVVHEITPKKLDNQLNTQ